MQSIVALAALVGLASAWGNSTYETTTTEVVSSYTTYCPSPTEIVEGNKTYTVTSVSIHPTVRTKNHHLTRKYRPPP